jgi:hypothetical protein
VRATLYGTIVVTEGAYDRGEAARRDAERHVVERDDLVAGGPVDLADRDQPEGVR